MDGATPEQLQRIVLRLALNVAKAAYEEALLRHGMLKGTVELIHAYADHNLADLEDTPRGFQMTCWSGCWTLPSM
ncbi:hypothetical protein ACGFNU_00020 [Spirillospora sp. NPDC048911]|uniref:hypothetical protein n=1 Tax=Spirillospora sp. NPDC048911 TaxID=3364527 RepID=UPI00371C8919